jgi:hypothetical protein
MEIIKKENRYYSYANAILALEPNAKFGMSDPDDLSTLEWQDDSVTKPTDAAIQAQYDADMAIKESKQYILDRTDAYPSIQEQLDMQYWDSVNGTTTWADAIAAVKAANPKPE